jgi:hypothetical protein
MGYLKIPNLYSDKTILMFRECWALEKIHGTSAHVAFRNNQLKFFAGGASHEGFIKLFNHEELTAKFKEVGVEDITVFGEAYGGKMQGMSKTYGPALKFTAFDVKIGELWLDVLKAESIVKQLGLEFVYFQKISTELSEIDKARDMNSVQAVRNGMGDQHIQEGVVLKPLIELHQNNGNRIVAKHKRREFMETASERSVNNEEDFRKNLKTEALVNEWVTVNRLKNALSHFPEGFAKIENVGELIKYIGDDVIKESNGEVSDSKEIRKLMARQTALIFKKYLNG